MPSMDSNWITTIAMKQENFYDNHDTDTTFMVHDTVLVSSLHPFDSGSAGCQALHGLGCNRRRSNSPV